MVWEAPGVDASDAVPVEDLILVRDTSEPVTGPLQAVSVATGEVVWEAGVYQSHEVVVAHRIVYTVARDLSLRAEEDATWFLFALDLDTGDEIWRMEADFAPDVLRWADGLLIMWARVGTLGWSAGSGGH